MALLKTGLLLASLFIFSCNNQPEKQIVVHTIEDSGAPTTATPVVSEKKPDVASCLQIVFRILTTSDRYLAKTKGLYEAVVKNGGSSFGLLLEGSPHPKQDTAMAESKTYDYSLHETYPDRDPVIARYTFDPVKKQLYELDVAEDTLIPIGFDKTLLAALDKCR